MNGTDSEIIEYDKKEGVIFPSVSGSAGAGDVIMKYINGGGMAFPTVAVIAPDRKIVENYDAYNSYYDDLSKALKKYPIDQTMISDPVPADNIICQEGMIINAITAGTIELYISNEGHYTLHAYSLDGKRLLAICDQVFSRGNHRVACNLGQLAGKVVILKGSSGHNSVVKKFVMHKKGIGK